MLAVHFDVHHTNATKKGAIIKLYVYIPHTL